MSRGVLRVMVDTNIFYRLDADAETVAELSNRRDIRLLVSSPQLDELTAIPDEERRSRYRALASKLCAKVGVPEHGGASPPSGAHAAMAPDDRHRNDRLIAAAALSRCDVLVTDDIGLLDYARAHHLRAVDWNTFVGRMLFGKS